MKGQLHCPQCQPAVVESVGKVIEFAYDVYNKPVVTAL